MTDLLEILDAFVKRDSAPPGFAGRIAIGIEDRWWVVELGSTVITSFVSDPGEVDAALMLTTDAAAAILAGDALPAGGVHHRGDQALLGKVFDRYLRKIDLIGIRSF